MFSLMAGKKKNKSTVAKRKSKDKPLKAKSRPTPRKAAPRRAKAKAKAKAKPKPKEKTEDIVLPVLNADKLKELYSIMVKCRMLAERAQSLTNISAKNLLSGLEATLVGAGAHLQPKDCIALEHGSFLASLIKGTPLPVIVSRMNAANNTGTQASLREAGPAITRSMAQGLALAKELKGTGTVTLMFGSQQPGFVDFEPAAMTIAATEKLPIVCLVECSFDARAETHTLPVPSDSHGVGTGYYPKITVDGCDVVGVFRVAQEAIRRAREGHGPAVIECMTSRANDAANNADSKKTQHTATDPLPFMEKYLKRRDLWSAEWSRGLIKAFTKELNDAFAGAHTKSGDDAAFDNVYSADASSEPHTA
jgi:TPP-dependent pyruvate/acetoin dehydrogenase alpha subunit